MSFSDKLSILPLRPLRKWTGGELRGSYHESSRCWYYRLECWCTFIPLLLPRLWCQHFRCFLKKVTRHAHFFKVRQVLKIGRAAIKGSNVVSCRHYGPSVSRNYELLIARYKWHEVGSQVGRSHFMFMDGCWVRCTLCVGIIVIVNC